MSESSDFEWYVAHTYSGYEDKVKKSLEQFVINNGFQDRILEVSIPVEVIKRMKNGKPDEEKVKILPGYVFVKMKLTDETWYAVRNTRGVTGFVGAGNTPFPLSETDFASIFEAGHKMAVSEDGAQDADLRDLKVGGKVQILEGQFENHIGKITSIDYADKTASVQIVFNNYTFESTFNFDQIVKADNA